MTYRLSMAVDDNLCLEIEHSNFQDLLDEFDKMGGSRDWLLNTARAAVAASLHGEAVRTAVRGLNGSVIATEETPSPAGGSTVQDGFPASSAGGYGDSAPTTRTAPPSDPWSPPPPDEEPPWSDDPWGAPAPQQPVQQQYAPPQQQARPPAQQPAQGGPQTTRDRFDREWTTGLPNAPMCHCGVPAARMKAKAQNSGKWYTKWRCSKEVGPNYKEKCGFDEFPQR